MKDLVFLPDREGRDELTAADGFVRVSADASGLQTLTDRMCLPAKAAGARDDTMWRGVLALALLCDAWPEMDMGISLRTVDTSTSLFAAWVLSARPAQERRDAVHLALLERSGRHVLLGVADRHDGLILPAAPSDYAGMIPARAVWYDAENDAWQDPVPYLNEHERVLLLNRLEAMALDSSRISAFKAALRLAGQETVRAVRSGDENALDELSVRICAVCGLQDFEAFALRREVCAVTAENPLVCVFAPADPACGEPEKESFTYLWEGIPFACTSAALGLAPVCDDCQEQALARIGAELRLLEENSVPWNQKMAAGIADWLRSCSDELLPEVRSRAEAVRSNHREKGLEIGRTVSLVWPWDASSGAVRYLLKENLGEGWMRGAANPFADRLTKLTGHVLGDTALQNCCACADGVLLPPLSREMAQCSAAAKDGEGLALDALRFVPQEDGGITASFLLRGTGEMQMVRSYAAEEILVIKEEEAPCVAVWPCLPMERWRAYHVFTRAAGVQVAALTGGEWSACPPEEPAALPEADAAEQEIPAEPRPWRCLHTESYPACLVVLKDGLCLGALPNGLPLFRPEESGDAVAAIDMGASCTAVVLTVDGKPVSAQGQQLTRLLVMPQEMPADDFLSSLTPNAITPSAVALTGDGDTLFTDGYIYAVTRFDALQGMTPGTVHTALKWRADPVSVRARKILLHQVMLGASLNAMLCGVRSLRWRVTVADEMGDEGRNALLDLVEELSAAVAEETGLPISEGKTAVIWAEEAAALHAFLRDVEGQKGSFAVLDVGGGSIKLHLWMQGRSKPSAGAVLMEGSQTALLRALRGNPDLLRADFTDCGNEALIAAVEVLCGQLALARDSLIHQDKALLMLDALLDEYKQPITQHLYNRFNAQNPAYMQTILLEMLSAAMFNVGLMLEQAGGDSIISHLFPADLTVCLTGRGAWLLDSLTPQLRNGLQRIAHTPMALRHPVRTLTIRPAHLPDLGIAMGMAYLRETEMPIDMPIIRTRQSFSELMRGMVQQLFQCYPLHMWLSHPGLFDQWGNLTAAGDDTLRRVASASYGDGEDIPASVMDFVDRLRKEPVLPALMVSPGE